MLRVYFFCVLNFWGMSRYEMGYGGNLVEALYIFYDMAMGKKMSVKERIVAGIKASHPHIAKRIGRLETMIDADTEES